MTELTTDTIFRLRSILANCGRKELHLVDIVRFQSAKTKAKDIDNDGISL